MKNPYLEPGFLAGVKEDAPPDTEDRTYGQLATDVGIKLLDPVVTAGRTVTGLARSAENEYLGGQDKGVAADVDRWLGRQQTALQEEGLSPRQKAIDESKWFNRGPDERSAWDNPIQAITSQTLGLVAPGVAIAATGGTGAAPIVAGMAAGALDAGDAINAVRNYTDQTSLEELKKYEPFNEIYRNNGGDEIDARHQLFLQSVDMIDVAANVGANIVSFGTLGHALGRAGKKVPSGMLRFLGRAAFGVVEGGAAGALEGGAGELTAQRAAVRQGRQDEVSISKIVGAAEEAVPGMAIPVGAAHAIHRGPAEVKPGEQYGPPPPTPKQRADQAKTDLDADTKGVLTQQINPVKAMETNRPPSDVGEQMAPPWAEPYGPPAPNPDMGPPSPFAEQYGPPQQNLSGPQQPQPGGVWGQAQPGVWGNVPRPPPGGPPGPPGGGGGPPPPVGGGIWRGARPEVQARMSPQYGPHEPYGPPAPPPPPPARPAPPRGPSAGGGVWANTRTGYLPGQPTERVGPPHPDAPQYGPPAPPPPPAPLQPPPSMWGQARPNLQSNVVLPPPSAAPSAPTTVHLSPEDAKKIRPGFRLAPGMREGTFDLVTKGNKHVGRVRAVDREHGTVPVSFGADGVVRNKGRVLGGADFPMLGPNLPTDVYGPHQPTEPTAAPAGVSKLPAATPTGPSAPELHAAPLRPGRAMWRSNVGVHEVEIIPSNEYPGVPLEDKRHPGQHKIRYDITDKAGRNYRDEAWVNTSELTQAGGPPSATGGPTGPVQGGGGRPARGTMQEQLREAAGKLFTPTNEPISKEDERTIRGAVATADDADRPKWADRLSELVGERRNMYVREADLPREMRRLMDDHETTTLLNAMAQNPDETIEIIRHRPLTSGQNPTLQELDYRLEGRADRGGRAERRATGQTRAQREGFAPIVRVPEGRHALAVVEHEPTTPPTAQTTPRSRLTGRQAEEQARRNLEIQQEERIRRPAPIAISQEEKERRPTARQEEPTAHVRAYEAREMPAAEASKQRAERPRTAPGIDPVNLKADINAYNLRVDYLNRRVSEDTAVERERLQRMHDSLQARTDQLDALRYRRGLPEDHALRRSIAERPKDKPKPRTQEEEKAAEATRAAERANRTSLEAWIKQQTPEVQENYETAKAITNTVVKPRVKLVAGRMLPQIARQLWQKLSDSAAGRDYQKKLQAADRARVRGEGKQLVDPSQGAFWSNVYRKYWRGLTKATKGKLLREAAAGMGRTLSPAQLREAVIKEVEALHAAARLRVEKKGVPPLPVRTAKIAGMRQKQLPPELPTETEALERLEDVQRRQASQQRKQKQRDKEYTDREQVVNDTLQTAVNKRFGTVGRFSDLITTLFNHSLIKPPPREFSENPSLFQRTRDPNRQRGTSQSLSGTRAGSVDFIVRKKRKEGEDEGERRATPLTGRPDKPLTPAQLRQEQLEDRQLEVDKRYSLQERLRRAKQEGRTEDAERLAGEIEAGGEDEDTTTKTSRIRRENIYVQNMEDFFKVKDMQLNEAKQLRKFVDHLIEQLAKNLEKKRVAEGYSGIGIKWHLPQARLREKGLKVSQQAEGVVTAPNAPVFATRKHFSAGEADTQFAAYSFTADLQNLREALDFAIKGVDNLGKGLGTTAKGAKIAAIPTPGGTTRVLPGSAQRRWNPRMGRSGKVVTAGEAISTRQDEIARYMGPLNRMLLDFSWRIDKAMQGDWEAIKNVRTAQTEAFARSTLGESLEAREEKQRVAIEAGEPAGADVASPDIGRGKGEAIGEVAADIIDKRMEVALARAWAKERQAGRLQNVSFDAYKEQHFADLKARMERDFPMKGQVPRVEPLFPTQPENTEAQALARTTPARRGIGPTHDEKGLPVDRRRAYNSDDVEADGVTPTAEAVARMHKDQLSDQAHEDLGLPGTPRDPLISAPETTTAVLDRLKGMIRDGTAGDLPERYINDNFIDQLARITQGTEVYHAPYDAVAGPAAIRGGSWASYLPHHDRVVLSNDVAPDNYARSVLHETVHAATEGRLNSDPLFAKDVGDLLNEARAEAERQGLKPGYRDLYGLTNPHEYLTESVSNQKFRDFLESVGTDKPGITGPKTLLQATYRAIRNTFARVIGFFHANTALDVLYYDQSSVLGRTDALIKRSMDQIEREGRVTRMPSDPTEQARHADGRYFARGVGPREFIKDLPGEARIWGKDVSDRAKYAWETRDKARALGLGLMTQYDQTKIGRPEFREKSAAALDTIEKIFAEGNQIRDADKRELAKVAKIFYGWSKGNRQRAAEGLFDESNHSFWADRELTDKGNEHYKDDLANAQAREEHEDQKAEYQWLSQNLNGYDTFRAAVHKFSEVREEAMRKGRIKDLAVHGNLIDPDLDPALRDRLGDAIQQWVDVKPQRLTPPTTGWMATQNSLTRQRHENVRETLERVPQAARDLIKQHLNVDDANVLDRVHDIRSVPDMQRLPGPYVPFTRQGQFAISGNFLIDKPANAIVLEGDINHATGEPIGNDRFVFKTEAEARAFERQVTAQFHIKQLDGGVLAIDPATNQRVMVPLKDDPTKSKIAGKAALKRLREAGKNIEDRYFVEFQKKNLYFYDTEYDAKKASDAMKAEHGDGIEITQPKDVFQRDGRQNEQFVGTELQRQIDHLRQSVAFQRLDPHEQGGIIDNLKLGAAQYTMKRGIKQRYLPRGYVKGVSTNILGALDEYSGYSGRYLAKLHHQSELKGHMEGMKQWLKAEEHSKDVLAEQRVYNSMSHRLNSPTENPRDNLFNRWVDRALKWTMLDKLPGIGYFMANATDTVATALPLIIGRHNAARAIAAMARMYVLARKIKALRAGGRDLIEALKSGSDMTDYGIEIQRAVEEEVDGSRLGRLYSHAFGRGVFDASANLEYQNTYTTNKATMDKVADWGTGIFQAVNTAIENVNRFVSLGTAYRLEFDRLTRKKGMSEEDAHNAAVEYAMNIAHEANGIYANFNTPEYFNKGPLAKMVFQFKKYPQRIMMNYIRAAQGVIGLAKGEFTEENKERAKQLVALLATQGLLAGALGMPTDIFSMPLNAMYLMGLSKYNWDDAQAGFRQWAAKEFGHEGGQLVSHGLVRTLTGTAFDQRLSQSNMIAFGSPGSRKSTDVKASVANFFFGATGGSAFQALTGIQKLSAAKTSYFSGAYDLAMKQFGEGMRNLIPLRFVTDALETANRSRPEGVETMAGRQMRKPLTTGEAVWRGVTGIPLAREAESGDARRDMQAYRTRYIEQRKMLSDTFAQSPPGMQREDVWKQVQRFNAANPGMPPLTRSDLLKASGTRAMAEKAPSSLLGLPDDKFTVPLRKRGQAYVTGE